MSQITTDQFRQDLPAFKDPLVYEDPAVQFWLDMADQLHHTDQWKGMLRLGIELYTAHNLSLEFNANRNAKFGRNPGEIVGATTSGTVDKVSYSRSTAGIINPKDGHWALSVYGLRYLQLFRMIGASPQQTGPGCEVMVGGWPGPNIYPPL